MAAIRVPRTNPQMIYEPIAETCIVTEQIQTSLSSLISLPQGSVQIELIFRLLLKITVDWPSNAIIKCL